MPEPAPEGDTVAARPILVLFDEADPAALAELDAELCRLPRTASEEECARALAKSQAPRTLVDLRLWGWSLAGAQPPPAAREALLAVFRLGRALMRSDLQVERVIVPTSLDGASGLGAGGEVEPAVAAAHGAAGGAWKSVVREWSEAKAGPPIDLSLVDLAVCGHIGSVLKRVITHCGPAEVGYGDGNPSAPVLRPAALSGGPSLTADSTVLLTGGAGGVTARIARELAARFRCRLVLADRIGLAAAGTPRLDLGSARRRAREQLGTGAGPQEINTLAQQVLGEQRAAETVADLEALGSPVLYCQEDITDPESAVRIVRRAEERFGPLDLVIHGAGIDRSRSILVKDEEEVSTVLAVKTAAAALFAAAGARAVGLCSVAGRLGNAGQIDYCAANEALAKLALAYGGLAVDFTAWADIGMAAPIAKAMHERGVDPLASNDAARVAVDLIASKAAGEYVIAGRLRPRDSVVAEQDTLAGELLFEVPGAELRREVTLELETAAFLRDHRPTSAGLLPAVVALQAMGDAASFLEPRLPRRGFRDLRIEQAVKVFANKPVTIQVEAMRRATEAGAATFATQVTTRAGVHHRTTVVLGGATAPVGTLDLELDGPGPTGTDIYRTFFHGPSFRVLESTQLGADGLRARSVPLTGDIGCDLPEAARPVAMARELVLQAAGAFLMTAERRLALPVGFAELNIAGAPKIGERVEALVRFRRAQSDEELFFFDALLQGEDGRDLERFSGLCLRFLGRL